MYSTNAEYRTTIRAYFHMDTRALEEEYAYLKESDPDSYDENLYDEEAMKRGMNEILEKTKDDQRFSDLYIKAAAQFLSEDLDTGLCVLLTFDYFADFIKLYENPTEEGFKVLLNKL